MLGAAKRFRAGPWGLAAPAALSSAQQLQPVAALAQMLDRRGLAEAAALPRHPADTPRSGASGLAQFLPQCRGLLVDAAGTLIQCVEPAAAVYLRAARRHGCDGGLSEAQVLQRFREAYNTPWGRSTIRYVGDGRPFWRWIVDQSLGRECSDALHNEVYDYYAAGSAYRLAPGALEVLQRLRARGLKLAVVSNFDTRLRRILRELGAGEAVWDAIVVSAEVRAEKPNPIIFEAACRALALPPESCVHVGDDRRTDLWGARDAGCGYAWLWNEDVFSFEEVERRIVEGNYCDSLELE